jgi:hypothetical protein
MRYDGVAPYEAAESPSRVAKARGMPRGKNQTTGYPGFCFSLSCEDHLFRDSLEETFRIGREAHIPIQIFHFEGLGKSQSGSMPRVVAMRSLGTKLEVK